MLIYSVFSSVNGEVNVAGMGSIATFIRFAGCTTANCSFCDTEYAKDVNSGTVWTLGEVMNAVHDLKCNRVLITGGEPLEQKEDLALLTNCLMQEGYQVSIETNGYVPFDKKRFPWSMLNWIVDIKPENKSIQSFISMNLGSNDYLKQVVGSESEFVNAMLKKQVLQNHGVRATFAFSPEYGIVEPNQLLTWMKKYEQTDAVLNVQLHKILCLTEES